MKPELNTREFTFRQLELLENRLTVQDAVFRILSASWIIALFTAGSTRIQILGMLVVASFTCAVWVRAWRLVDQKINTLEDLAVTFEEDPGLKQLLVVYRKRDTGVMASPIFEALIWMSASGLVVLSRLI
jgi:hypothetical protein